MVDLYVKLIIKGLKIIDDVPEALRNSVEERLKSFGYPT